MAVESTQLPRVLIYAGPLRGDRHLCAVTLSLRWLDGGENAVVPNTGGLRVLLRDGETVDIRPETDWDAGGHQVRRFHRPLALRVDEGSGSRRSLTLRLPANSEHPAGREKSGELRLSAGPMEAVVAPVIAPDLGDEWPRQEIPRVNVPALRLEAGRIRVLLPAPASESGGSELAQFLRLRRRSGVSDIGLIFGEIQVPLEDRHLALDLTRDGIEFDALNLPDPAGNLKRLPGGLGPAVGRPLRVRLVWRTTENEDSGLDPGAPYLLELVDETSGRFDDTLDAMLAQVGSGGSPLLVGYDGRRTVAPVRWEVLYTEDEKLKFSGVWTGTGWESWRAQVDPRPLRVRLVTQLVQGPAAPREQGLAEILLDRVELQFNSTNFRLGINPNPASPDLRTTWQRKGAGWSAATGGLQDVQVRIPTRELGERLLALYTASHALPPGTRDPGYAFVPLRRGWLQLPFLKTPEEIRTEEEPTPNGGGRGFAGVFHVPLDTDLNTRRVTVRDSQRLSATVTWARGGAVPQSVLVESVGSRGHVTGLFFVAEASPTPVEILPTMAGGPAATRALPLLFGDTPAPTDWTGKLTTGANGQCWVKLNPVKNGYLAWRPHRRLPMISAMNLTRTAASSPQPSGTRGLVPVECTGEATLTWSDAAATLPDVSDEQWQWSRRWRRAGETDPFEKIGFTLPLVPGVLMQPADQVTNQRWQAALRYDLPGLDELFATSSLPQRTPDPSAAAGAVGVQTPTALDPDGLERFWAQSRDRLALAASQAALAWKGILLDDDPVQVDLPGLVEPFTWRTKLGLRTELTMEGSANRRSVGQLYLDKSFCSPAQALAGHTDRIRFPDAPAEVPVRNFAASLYTRDGEDSRRWDSRGFGLSRQPVKTSAVSYREAALRRAAGEAPGELRLATLATPVSFVLGEGRTAEFWFRDLPLVPSSDDWAFNGSHSPLENGTGFDGQAFDRVNLPKSLYEWRLYDLVGGAPCRRYDLRFGPFAFRPLTLEEVVLGGNDALKKVRVVGSLHLADGEPVGERPISFGPERIYEHGNLVELEVDVTGGTHKLKPHGDQPLRFPLELELLHDGTRVPSAPHAAELELKLGEGSAGGGFTFTSVELGVRLLGRGWNLSGTLTAQSGAGLTFTFLPPAQAPSNPAVGFTRMDLVLRLAATWQATLDLRLSIHLHSELDAPGPRVPPPPADSAPPAPVFRWQQLEKEKEEEERKSAFWFDLPVAGVPIVDHTTGRIRMSIDGDSQPADLFTGFPIPGLAVRGVVEILPFSLDPEDPDEPAPVQWPAAARPAALWLEIRGRSNTGPELTLEHQMASPTGDAAPPSLKVTRTIEGQSGISWPAAAATSDAAGPRRAFLDVDPLDVLSDHLAVTLNRHEFPLAALREGRAGRIVMEAAWQFIAVVSHTLRNRAGETVLAWRAVEHVRIASDSVLVREARDRVEEMALEEEEKPQPALDFAPRRRHGRYRTQKTLDFLLHPGLSVPATALAGFLDRHLLNAIRQAAPTGGLFVFGGAPTLFTQGAESLAATTAFVLTSLVPRPIAVGEDKPAPSSILPLDALDQQAGTNRWVVSDLDADLTPIPTDRTPPTMVTAGGTQAALERGIHEAFIRPTRAIAASAIPVEQSFFELTNASTAISIPAGATKEVPYFVRPLLVLSRVRSWPKETVQVHTLVAARNHGYLARLGVAQPVPGAASPPEETRLVALSATGEIGIAPAPHAAGTALFVAQFCDLAENMVVEPVCLLLSGEGPTLPRSLEVRGRADDLGGGARQWLPADPLARRSPSPALGWPSPEGIRDAAAFPLTIGEGEVLVEKSVGVVGRSETFAGPAWAPTVAGGDWDGVSLHFTARVLFQRPALARSLGPAARHLRAGPVRLRGPVREAVARALRRVLQDPKGEEIPVPAAPITPPQVERGDFGARPGVFQVLTTGVTLPAGDVPFDPVYRHYGRPITSGPVIAHQLRSPRAVCLPDVDDLKFRRRTYLSLADRGAGGLRGYFLAAGPAAAMRHVQASGSVEHDWRFLLQLPSGEQPALNRTWKGGLTAVLHAVTTEDIGRLEQVAKETGWLIPKPAPATGYLGPQFTLVIGALSFPMTGEAALGATAIRYTLQINASLEAARAALDAATADTPVLLVVTVRPRDAGSYPLPAGPPRVLSLPLNVVPLNRLTLPVKHRTLLFGDPSYDRQLGSQTASIIQTAPDGKNFLLALDREEYDLASPVHLAVGPYSRETNRFLAPNGEGVSLGFFIQPGKKPGREASPERRLRIEKPGAGDYTIQLPAGASGEPSREPVPIIAFPFSDFVEANTGAPVSWVDGDRLIVRVRVEQENSAEFQVSVRFSKYPVIAPPPSVYSLVRCHRPGGGDSWADVPLHATGPMPQDIEFPRLRDDLASGYVRRQALFNWLWSEVPFPEVTDEVTFIKLDRSGGSQLPNSELDFEATET